MADAAVLWSFILQALADDKPLALAIVVATHGSVPARVGTKMAITLDAAHGTLGGGVIEERMLRQARDILRQHEQTTWIQTFGHETHGNDNDAVLWCGGAQTLLIHPCKPADRLTVQRLLSASRNRQIVSYRLDSAGLAIDIDALSDSEPAWRAGAHWQYCETLRPAKRAYIVGAGHCGQALAQVLRWLAFDVALLECREVDSFASLEGHQPWRVVDYSTIDQIIPEADDSFVFVMTHRHSCDHDVIARLAGKSFAYLGLLGSVSKVDRIKAALSSHVDTEHLEKLRAPMGLPIASHAPHEIAISIAAEVLKVINGASLK